MELPAMQQLTESESRAVKYQLDSVARTKRSPYWIVEETKAADNIERYSDRYRQTGVTHPSLKSEELCQEFFPKDLWDGYFNPAKPPKGVPKKRRKATEKLSLEDLELEENKGDNDDGAEGSELGSDDRPDYDEEVSGDDYENNYFDNGEDDDDDMNAGDGGGGGDIEFD